MKISDHFELEEFTKSATATKKGIENCPSQIEIENIINLVKSLLEPLRALFNSAMIINSGYRSKSLNKAVGGSPTSQHLKGEAADISCHNPKELLDKLKKSNLEFDQAILYPTFLHLSLKKNGVNRREIIVNMATFFLLLFTSCSKPIYLQGKTEYIEKIVTRDTVIHIEVEREVLNVISGDSSQLETLFALSKARVDTLGRLFHTLEQKEQKLEKVVEFKEKIITVRDSIPYPQIIEKTKEVKHIPKIFWISMVVSAFFVGRIVYNILRVG